MPISLHLLSEHASFCLISKVLIVSFAEISKQMRVLCCLWLLGFEEMETGFPFSHSGWKWPPVPGLTRTTGTGRKALPLEFRCTVFI